MLWNSLIFFSSELMGISVCLRVFEFRFSYVLFLIFSPRFSRSTVPLLDVYFLLSMHHLVLSILLVFVLYGLDLFKFPDYKIL